MMVFLLPATMTFFLALAVSKRVASFAPRTTTTTTSTVTPTSSSSSSVRSLFSAASAKRIQIPSQCHQPPFHSARSHDSCRRQQRHLCSATSTVATAAVEQEQQEGETTTTTTTTTAGADAVVLVEATTVQQEPLPTNEDDIELLQIRHSASHVMAMAVQQLYPEAQVTIGPWIDNGFYYDFYFPSTSSSSSSTSTTTDDGTTTTTDVEQQGGRKLSDADLKQIKTAMDKIIAKNYEIRREEVSVEEARRRIAAINEPFKMEILEGIIAKSTPTATTTITIYHIGDQWWDLCAGPHVASTGQIPKKAVELQSVAGAYWRGDEQREMLQRIYATAWKTPDQLQRYKKLLAEAKKRDHRTVGKKLDLFSVQEDAGGGLVFWHPKGSKVRAKIEEFWRSAHVHAGYDLVYSPHIANVNLWKTSGHFDFYRDDMFDQIQTVENEAYQLKPMNCPFHCLMYKDELRSYRDLPLRWAELGTVYRYERSGTLHGLFRVRGFTQDDAHIFCLPSQLEDEIVGVLDLTETILTKFGFTTYDIKLSTRPEKSVGSDVIWEAATTALRGALDRKRWSYGVDEGGGAFYGPKIDLKIRDAIGRSWQCSTVQCDFNLPDRFGLEYVSAEGVRERPIMVHRAIFGSLERFFGILIENCAGDFPLWLAPTQLRLLPVTDAAQDYCHTVARDLQRTYHVRVEVDRGNERLPKQIRNAEQQRIPLMAIVGMQEVESQTLSIRSRKLGDLGRFAVDDLGRALMQCSTDAVEMTTVGNVVTTAPTVTPQALSNAAEGNSDS